MVRPATRRGPREGRGLLANVRESGFPYPQTLIHLFIGGSELHGAKVQGTDDMDIYGLYVEPPAIALGLEPLPHYVWSTSGSEVRNGPNDVDVTLYSLRKWAGLACKGNPTALHFLFAEPTVKSATWTGILERKQLFLARSCMPQFLGFADAQLKRMTGQLGRGKKGQRPELEQKYGYDVKSAMHTLRLLYECKELLSEGRITLPRPERELLIRVRTGAFSMEEVLDMAKKLFLECEEAGKRSALPERVDRGAVSAAIAEAYREHWAS
ncbi:MAG TPA: nucleotidyltransferase domain-containing protein [Terriglobales bacterium]|jgi:predicted nucleotidyltransferase|nr:nucleotidyltransferase domain-containing protein [Terriglobales bacterium]